MKLPHATSKEEAQTQAIVWQQWQSEQDLSYAELAEWQAYFTSIAKEYDLEEEFKENGII